MTKGMYVFVYGTLRWGERNHPLLAHAERIAEQACTAGKIFTTCADYPVLQEDTESRTYGELYRIDHALLEQLDALEGYEGPASTNNLYERVKQQVYTDKGEFTAFVYVTGKQTAKIKLIEEGDWLVHTYLQNERLLYFAYGSCMDDLRFKKQQVDQHFQKVVGRGKLDGYTLRYTINRLDGGRADIVEEGGLVEGKVYEIAHDAVSYLYEREGVYAGSYRPAVVQVRLDKGRVVPALTFIVVHKEKETAPPSHYIEEILRGGRGCCSKAYIKMLENQYMGFSNVKTKKT
ncbi:gamma-glutamylcyclotransferase [Virgibacillus halophilus]|uniref:gamma-glutamylcyclotransferase n=1 Tax=Tigheibacillus halophilus TaxID=361280 RepID=UPI0036F32E8B